MVLVAQLLWYLHRQRLLWFITVVSGGSVITLLNSVAFVVRNRSRVLSFQVALRQG